MEVLDEEADISMRRHRDEKSNIQQIVHHLNFQREGLTPLGSVIAGDTHHLASSRGMQAESDCRKIKSIRRPLAPETTRDHGNRPAIQSNLQSNEGSSVVPRTVEREILRRQTMRLKTKRQDQERSVKQREMQLEDTVGVYTRINMIKGSLNYKGKPRHRYEKSRKAIAFSKLSLVHT
ncbi:hypothetical protein OS493_030341 [Desmophyllum pertusum]|uniref:Uncharacterized protein n=1 Tax=Desmophyllum pertusum TaxID=174260 RepID=A0A9W9ZKV4_9CNID|nr:hypothetical protein OS493_030341 [Desmophyllum pertusum]